MATCASGQAIFAKWLRPCATRKSPRSHRSIARLPRKISAQNWKLLARPAIFLLVCWWRDGRKESASRWEPRLPPPRNGSEEWGGSKRSEEHTSELQSRENLVCRLLLEK